MPDSAQFYTYLWLRYDGTPYYVGKGIGKRAIRKGSPKDLDCILIQEHLSEADALVAEIFLITYYGRKDLGTGILHNHTNGGDQPPSAKGIKRSKEFRNKMRIALIGSKRSLGYRHTEETRAEMSAARMGNKYSLGNKNALGYRHAAETRMEMSVTRRGRIGHNPSAETRAKISKALKGNQNYLGNKSER